MGRYEESIQNQARVRNIVDGVYDIQKVRIAVGNRIVAAMSPKVKKPTVVDKAATPDEKKKKDEEDLKILKLILTEYGNITDVFVEQFNSKGNIEKAISNMEKPTEFIRNRIDYELVTNYQNLRSAEESLAKTCARVVEEHPMWEHFFKDVKGCGPIMAAICIAYLDPYKARHCSSFWKYCGLDVVTLEDGTTEGRRKKHTEMREYTDKETGEVKQKRSITYNPFVKAKLVEVLGGSFVRARGGSEYGDIYWDYRHRQENMYPDKPPIFSHRRALRYMVKMFLRDLWVAWRTYEGLEVSEPYEVAKLGMKPHKDPNLPDGMVSLNLK